MSVVAVDLPGLFTSLGALLTAIGGFILVIRRLNDQKEQVNRVEQNLNGTSSPPQPDGSPTLGQRVERIERNTEEGFRLVTGELEALRGLFRQFGMRMDETLHRMDDRAADLDRRFKDRDL